MPFTLAGYSGTVDEVDAASRARHVTILPNDHGALGAYSIGFKTGNVSSATKIAIFTFRWTQAVKVALIRYVQLSIASSAAGSTSTFMYAHMIKQREWASAATGGTDIAPSTNDCKKKTTMGASLVGGIRVATTAALTTNSLTDWTIAQVATRMSTTSGWPVLAPYDLWSWPGNNRSPIVLRKNEGFTIEFIQGTASNIVLAGTVEWEEIDPTVTPTPVW